MILYYIKLYYIILFDIILYYIILYYIIIYIVYIVYIYIPQAAWPGEKSLSHQPGGEIHRTDHRLERHGLRVATVLFFFFFYNAWIYWALMGYK